MNGKTDGRIESIPLTLTVGGENIIDDENFDQKDFFQRRLRPARNAPSLHALLRNAI